MARQARRHVVGQLIGTVQQPLLATVQRFQRKIHKTNLGIDPLFTSDRRTTQKLVNLLVLSKERSESPIITPTKTIQLVVSFFFSVKQILGSFHFRNGALSHRSQVFAFRSAPWRSPSRRSTGCPKWRGWARSGGCPKPWVECRGSDLQRRKAMCRLCHTPNQKNKKKLTTLTMNETQQYHHKRTAWSYSRVHALS